MVGTELLNAAQQLFAGRSLKIAVTGATGFVGSHLTKALCAAGQDVTAIGRNSKLAPPNANFSLVDISDFNQVSDALKSAEVVVHCAAQASPWLSESALYDANVLGTENVINACLKHRIKRLVHVSSTAIHFAFKDRIDLSEDAPRPKRYSCGYAATKAAAESRVRESSTKELETVIVRARAVIGPGDNHLIPRILDSFEQGKLRIIGNGQNLTDLTYIDNLVWALMLAIQRGKPGSTCTITNHEPVKLWGVVEELLQRTGRGSKLKSIPYAAAMRIAHLMEMWHTLTNKSGEPSLTRYTVGLLAKSQTYSPKAATRCLGYQPLVPLREGIERTIECLNSIPAAPGENQKIKLQVRTTGYTSSWRNIAERGAPKVRTNFHALIAIIEHPIHGVILFDTGYSPRFFDASRKWPYSLYRKLTPVQTGDNLSAHQHLLKVGVEPSEVSHVIISHFHADHICGLADFPNSQFIAHQDAWNSIHDKTGMAALRRAFLPQLVPQDFGRRLRLISNFDGDNLGPCGSTHDLLNDGSIRLIELPGHAPGQLGVYLHDRQMGPILLVADACWTTPTITRGLKPTAAFKFIAADRQLVGRSLSRLQALARQSPNIKIIPTHCPDIASEFGIAGELADLSVDSAAVDCVSTDYRGTIR